MNYESYSTMPSDEVASLAQRLIDEIELDRAEALQRLATRWEQYRMLPWYRRLFRFAPDDPRGNNLYAAKTFRSYSYERAKNLLIASDMVETMNISLEDLRIIAPKGYKRKNATYR